MPEETFQSEQEVQGESRRKPRDCAKNMPNLGAKYTEKDLEVLFQCNSDGTYYRGEPRSTWSTWLTSFFTFHLGLGHD